MKRDDLKDAIVLSDDLDRVRTARDNLKQLTQPDRVGSAVIGLRRHENGEWQNVADYETGSPEFPVSAPDFMAFMLDAYAKAESQIVADLKALGITDGKLKLAA